MGSSNGITGLKMYLTRCSKCENKTIGRHLFETELEYYFRKRREQAFSAGYGKILCWHDYTHIRSEWPYHYYKCVKCGNDKKKSWSSGGIVEKLPNNY